MPTTDSQSTFIFIKFYCICTLLRKYTFFHVKSETFSFFNKSLLQQLHQNYEKF